MIKFVLENFDTIFKSKDSLENLDKLILDLAIKGKLVEQNPNDEPASELLKRIKEEKQRLIDEKVIKKEKPLPPIEEDEKPFKIPSNWEWVRLKDISYLNPRNKAEDDLEVSFVPMKLIFDKYENKHFSEKKMWKEIKNGFTHFRDGDIGIAKITPCFENRKSVIFNNLKNELGAGTTELYIIRTFIDEIQNRYLLNLFKTQKFIDGGVATYTGTAGQQRVKKEYIENYLIPLPPAEEQKRIVEKVEKLQQLTKKLKGIYISNEDNRQLLKKSVLLEIENSGNDKELLKNLEIVFSNFDKIVKTKEDIKDIRNLILSLAIKGKLVEQNPNDEPASELLKRIKEEKQRLIDEKVIKKEKPLPPIEEDEKPFKIPSNWEWVRMGDIGNWGSGATPSRTKVEYYKNGIIPWLKTGELNDNYIYNSEEKVTELALKETSLRLCKKGDILIAMYGATIGKLGILEVEATTNQACCACTVYKEGMYNKFLFYFLLAKKNSFKEQGVGGAQPNISKEKIIKTLISLPPIEEQKRIVEKVEKLMKICDLLESKLIINEKISENLLKSINNN